MYLCIKPCTPGFAGADCFEGVATSKKNGSTAALSFGVTALKLFKLFLLLEEVAVSPGTGLVKGLSSVFGDVSSLGWCSLITPLLFLVLILQYSDNRHYRHSLPMTSQKFHTIPF